MLAEVFADWESLAAQVEAAPFLGPGWIGAWWRAFGRGRLEVLTSRRRGRLRGVLPLAVRGGATCSPTNWHTPEFGLIATDAEAADDLIDQLFERHPRRVELSFLEPSGMTLGALSPPSGYAYSERTLMCSPYVATDGDPDSYTAGLSANLRKSLRRTRRRLEEQGELRFEVLAGGERLEPLLQEGFEMEAKGWKGERGTAILGSPQTHSFYSEVARWADEKGILRLAFLRLDDRAIAFQLALEDNRAFYALKHAFEPELNRFNPAKILTYETIRRCFEKGLESYEFLGADAPYKQMWTQDRRERLEVQLFSRSLIGRIDRVVRTRGRTVARRVRTMPALQRR